MKWRPMMHCTLSLDHIARRDSTQQSCFVELSWVVSRRVASGDVIKAVDGTVTNRWCARTMCHVMCSSSCIVFTSARKSSALHLRCIIIIVIIIISPAHGQIYWIGICSDSKLQYPQVFECCLGCTQRDLHEIRVYATIYRGPFMAHHAAPVMSINWTNHFSVGPICVIWFRRQFFAIPQLLTPPAERAPSAYMNRSATVGLRVIQ